MAGLSASAGSGFDYIQSAEPADPENADLWFDTDGGTDGNGEVKVYDGSQWDTTGYVSHDQLTNVSPGDHFSPGSGLSFSGGTLDLLLSDYLTIDGSGTLAVASGSLGQDRLAFDTATQSELDSHESDTTNPHNVDDSQTGAASALSNHASDSTAHHSPPKKVAEGTFTENRSPGDWVAMQHPDTLKLYKYDGTYLEYTTLSITFSSSMIATDWQDSDGNLSWAIWDMNP
ncbi:hypothetical protein [Haloarcula marismortui]|uniref:Uncharacterized protein n=1 Tax=Haloarcula marismortui ATCC 33800 TaxID=662476 RepID=M0JYB2_9EURY|nr:hypothetical protein [Haloarcula sinaiiensis]EMA12954.1 hypothetical protein C436_14425 [Haloarcula sinaiiensis ATCC 33800]QUJ71263.1 hypothetical protein KDQ40_11115 [Haloarcula sinaiiensis ATCC 33800]